MAVEATKSAEIKSRALIQGSYHFKAASPFASVDASSNFGPSKSENRLYLSKVETFPKEMNLDSTRNRLANAGNVGLASLANGIEDSFAGADGANQEILAKMQGLDSKLLNGDLGENTNLALRGSENDRIETNTVCSELNLRGTKTVHRKREKTRKRSSKKGDKRLLEEEDVEMLRQIARELDRENSQLTDMLRILSEQCQEINEDSNLLENAEFAKPVLAIEQDEIEKMYGEDAIAELRARNPAYAKPEINPNSNGDGSSERKSDPDVTQTRLSNVERSTKFYM